MPASGCGRQDEDEKKPARGAGGGEEGGIFLPYKIKQMIERLDEYAIRNPGTLLILNSLFISIAIVCTVINVAGLLR